MNNSIDERQQFLTFVLGPAQYAVNILRIRAMRKINGRFVVTLAANQDLPLRKRAQPASTSRQSSQVAAEAA